MAELGEIVFLKAWQQIGKECPFCMSKQDKTELTLELTNDSTVLGKNTSRGGGRKGNLINHPSTRKIKDFYKSKEPGSSYVANAAHHAIPGIEAFSRVPGLHKWMAQTVDIYVNDINDEELKNSPVGTEKKEFPGDDIKENELGEDQEYLLKVTHIKKSGPNKGDSAIRKVKRTINGKVYGRVEYDLNNGCNGVWLPGNGAFHSGFWTKYNKGEKKIYAIKAMKAQKYQFHDRHPAYSNSVVKELKNIEQCLKRALIVCFETCDDPDEDPIPAPQFLVDVLNKLSLVLIIKKLSLREGTAVKKSWSTSALAIGFEL